MKKKSLLFLFSAVILLGGGILLSKTFCATTSVSNLLTSDIEAMSQSEDDLYIVCLYNKRSTCVYNGHVVPKHYYSPH